MDALNLPVRILFLCTGNSCRSQMAQGWATYLKKESIKAFSAGTKPQGLNPLAVKVMKEVGVDISQQPSTHVDSLKDQSFDYVVTVCDSARENCPFFPGLKKTIHRSFDDPPYLARAAKSEEEALGHYRRVRDEIKTFIETMPEAL